MTGSASGSGILRFLAVCSVLLGAALLEASAEIRALEERLISLYQEHGSAMVRVKAVYPPEQEEEVPQVKIGSGFFISREGLILTNASIVSDPLRVWIEHDRIAYSAEVLGKDERSNIAFLRTHTLPGQFTFFHLVDQAELPPIGSFVVRLSMPLEFDASPQFGMVTGFESRFGDRFFPCTYIRTGIPAGPGDGGSAYLDLAGRLLGIQVGALPDVGSSYILPARAALRIRDDILFSGNVTYGWIGFEVDPQSSIENGRQIVLSEIFPDTPAKKAGLMEGDLLRQIGDYRISSLDQLRNAMFYARVGQYVDVRVLREGEPRVFSVQIVARPESEPLQFTDPERREPISNPLKDPEGDESADPLPFEKDLQESGDTEQGEGPAG